MARPSKMSVQKRQRERKKSEAAELKRESQRGNGGADKPAGGQVAERSDLEGYGVIPPFSDGR
jgi:hypothetical protein